jgi:hypothetical protein
MSFRDQTGILSGDLAGGAGAAPLTMPNSLVGFCTAQVREPDQRHQDERDDIVTIAWRPETGLLKDRVV